MAALATKVQRQVTKDWSVTAAYVGSLSRRLPFAVDINYPFYNSTATSANVNNRRAIDTGVLASIQLVESVMNAEYHGLQISVEKRMGKRLGVKSFYTFSKSLDDVQLQNNTTNGGAQNFRNLSEDRGRSDFDRHHNSVTSLIWNSSYYSGANAVARHILNGWMISAIVSLRSGAPFTVTAGKDVNLDGTNNDRANLIGNPLLNPNRSRSDVTNMWFNTAAFAVPLIANGTDGTAARNLLDGPGSHSIDVGIFRDFKIRERTTLQFRAEATNAFNLVNLSNPNGTFSSNLFGTIRNASEMRNVQLGLRLAF